MIANRENGGFLKCLVQMKQGDGAKVCFDDPSTCVTSIRAYNSRFP